MQVIEADDTALVVAQTLLSAEPKPGEDFDFAMARCATYVFKRDTGNVWRCVIDNSYGTDLIRSEPEAVLHLVCGKIGAGKSTLSQQLSANQRTILVSEDVLLSKLYPGQIICLADYVRCTDHLRNALGDHIEALLRADLSVVLDYPANTLSSRQWAKGICEKAEVAHQLHYLDVPDAVCKARLHERNASGTHPFATSDAEFDQITKHFVPPSPDEAMNIILHQFGK